MLKFLNHTHVKVNIEHIIKTKINYFFYWDSTLIIEPDFYLYKHK